MINLTEAANKTSNCQISFEPQQKPSLHALNLTPSIVEWSSKSGYSGFRNVASLMPAHPWRYRDHIIGAGVDHIHMCLADDG